MKDAKVSRIIFSSSATVYGDSNNLPLKESHPIATQTNQYGASKVAMEAFIGTYHKLYDFDVTILRYFNPYGPNEMHKPETHAIPNFIKSTLNKQPIPLYWKGEQVRDFIYVEDLARAHTKVLHVPGLEVFNVGTESGTKVMDVVENIFKIVGYKVPVQDLGPRSGDARATYASAEKIEKLVGWKAKVSIDEGLKKTIDFYKKRSS